MAITKDASRQYPLIATIPFTGGTDLTAVGVYEAMDIPSGATVIYASLSVETVFTALCTADVGDGVDPDRYTNAPVALTALGTTVLQVSAATVSGAYTYPANDTIDITLAGATAAVGQGTLTVVYMKDDRENEVQDPPRITVNA